MIQRNKINQENAEIAIGMQESNNNEINIFYNQQDYISHLLKQGKLEDVATYIKGIYKTVGQAHPFSSHYVYKPVTYGDKIVFDHVPINEQAAKEKPLMYKGKFNIDKKYFEDADSLDELFTKSMIKQEPIEIDVEYIETWIGDTKLENDEGTFMQEAVKTGKWVIPPEELPPPIKLKLVKKLKEDTSILDYLELNLSHTDKEKSILDNSRQDSSPLLVKFMIEKKSVRKVLDNGEIEEFTVLANGNITVSIKEGYEDSVQVNRTYLNYLLSTLTAGSLRFVNLETGKDFVKFNKLILQEVEDTNVIQKELEFLDLLLKIEKHFGFNFTFPDIVTREDREKIVILKSIMDKTEVDETFNDWTVEFSSPVGLGEFISIFDGKKDVNLLSAATLIEPIEVFGQSVSKVRMKNKFKTLVIDGLNRVKQKQACMDEGDIVRVKLIPGSDNRVKTQYTIESE